MTSRAVLRLPFLRRTSVNSYIFARRCLSHKTEKAAEFANSRFFEVSEEVRDAINTGKPVVALETTIYTHGFPYPENIALASLLESTVRTNGGVPATIGVFNGVARVGLDTESIIQLCSTAKDKSALKVSRRDLGYICGLGLAGKPVHGGTTVSGTMILAHLAGIKVFATGGLGGVHRGGELSMDISADLTELGRTPVAVISSGCKSFLDIPRTLEYLETEGVLVGTFADGRMGSVDFPGFWTRDSGARSPKVIQNEAEAAAMIFAQNQLPVRSGISFANPIPAQHSIPKEEMDRVIAEAVRLAAAEGAHGSDNTPFVLGKIKELTSGRSVVANRALIESNVQRATKVAIELSKLEMAHRTSVDRRMPVMSDASPTHSTHSSLVQNDTKSSTSTPVTKADVLVAGSLAVDFSCDFAPLESHGKDISPSMHTSNPAVIGQSLGGVGHNVALASHYVGSSTVFCSAVADDLSGKAALAALTEEGLSTEGVQTLAPSRGVGTAQYVSVNDAKKDLVVAMADMRIMELPASDLEFESKWAPLMEKTRPKWVVVDANWSPEVLAKWLASARQIDARVAFEPVSTAKAVRIFARKGDDRAVIGPADTVPNHQLNLATPNGLELMSLYQAARANGLFDSPGWWQVIDGLRLSGSGSRDRLESVTSAALVNQGIPQQNMQLLPFIPTIVTTLGRDGVLITQLLRPGDPRLGSPDAAPYIVSRADESNTLVGGVYMRLFPPETVLAEDAIVGVNGAGDTLLGVLVTGLAAGRALEDVIKIGQQASLRTLQSSRSVSPDIRDLAKLLR